MMWFGHGYGEGRWLLLILMHVVFWLLVIALIVWLVRPNRRDHPRPQIRQDEVTHRAEDVLAERFARGEIDEAEFEHRRQVLREHGYPPAR